MISPAPPIVQCAERVLRLVEEAVARWPRTHRYAHGTTLRTQAMAVAQLAHRAWRARVAEMEAAAPVATCVVSAHGDGGAVVERVDVIPVGGKWKRSPLHYGLGHWHNVPLFLGPQRMTEAQAREAFDKWAEDYGLKWEPNYSMDTLADCRAAYLAALRHAGAIAPEQEGG